MAKKKAKHKVTAKDIFDRYIARGLTGKHSKETIEIFCNFSSNDFYALAKKHKLQERQIASLVGFKDEFFVAKLVEQLIKEKGLSERLYCKKVTANERSGLSARRIKLNGSDKVLTTGGDCVIFRTADNKPLMIIECKEYIDMIRMKELIGESRVLKDDISQSKNLLYDIQFCVFAEVLELTEGWAQLFKNSDLKHKVDAVFVMRAGKRKDRENKPVKERVMIFRKYIEDFLVSVA